MSVKKDILAVITFLATGLLFFVAQAEEPGKGLFSTDVECDVAETVVVEDSKPEVSGDLGLKTALTRDS